MSGESNISFFGELSPKTGAFSSPTPSAGRSALSPKTPSTHRLRTPAENDNHPAEDGYHYIYDNESDARSPCCSRESPRSTSPKCSLRSASTNMSTGSSVISVIIGKTFEATTLPDGSQQIIEATKYKRLSDGHIFQETKMRSLDDSRSEDRSDCRDSVGRIVSSEGRREGVPSNDYGRTSDIALLTDVPGDIHGRSANDTPPSSSTNAIPPHGASANDTLPSSSTNAIPPTSLLGCERTPISHRTFSPTKELHEYPDGSLLATFSSSGSFSPTNESNFVSVVTEDHAFNSSVTNVATPRQRDNTFVEEYLYDDDPVGLQEYTMHQRHPSYTPSHRHQQTLSTPTDRENVGGCGWCPGQDSNDSSEDNSLQLVKQNSTRMRALWVTTPTKRATNAVRSFFPATPKVRTTGINGLPLDVTYGTKGNGNDVSDEDSIEDQRNTGRKAEICCHGRVRTRRFKSLVVAILMLVVGTIAAAFALISSKEVVVGNFIEQHDGKEDGSGKENVAIDAGLDTEVGSESAASPIIATRKDASAKEDHADEVEPAIRSEPPCIHLKIVMTTNDLDNWGDTNSWSLTRMNPNGKMATISASNYLPESDSNIHTYKHCVKPGIYTFFISDSGGNGLGDEGRGGYFITANDVTLGISSFFFHEERMTFTLPFDTEKHGNDHPDDDRGDASCSDDFFLAIKTDSNPGQTKWTVVDNKTGRKVLGGGPYKLPHAVYTHRACLPEGKYTFNMLDEGGDGLCCTEGRGFFVLSKEGDAFVNSDGKFGKESSTVFDIGV